MKLPAASGGVSCQKRASCSDLCNTVYSSSIPCSLTYLAILFSSPNLLTVFTKYPSLQNSPPHSCFFTSGCFLNISRPVMLLITVIILVGLYVGTDCTKKCTWFLSVPISRKCISYRFVISKHVSFNVISTSMSKTTLRYFAGHTK